MFGVDSRFNVFISQDEVRKLLGLSSELFYVRDGVVNTYAMNFVVPVPANITALHFSWQSLGRNPLPYVWLVEYNNRDAMLEPLFNITPRGVIPTQVQTFSVSLPCTGIRSAEVKIILQLNVTSYSRIQNDTSLLFRRNKICLREYYDTEPSPRNDSIRLDPDTLTSTNATFYVAVTCACVISVCVIAVSFLSYVRNTKSRTQDSLHTSYTSGAYAGNPNVFIRLNSGLSGSYATIASCHKPPLTPTPSPYATSYVATDGSTHHVYCKPASTRGSSRVSYYASSPLIQVPQLEPADRVRKLNVPRRNILTKKLLQEGTFGRVYRGNYLREGEIHSQDVIVKTVSDEASMLQVSMFLSEGTLMYGLIHKHILPVLAANTDPCLPPLLVYPSAAHGNLKRFLSSCRTRGGEHYTIITQDLVEMATQVATAAVYLHTQRIWHRDLATRNCVVDEKLQVKVTDSALSRDLYPADYHCLGDNENRPVKWLAYEALVHRSFSAASDVWAFGVVLWELITLVQDPYSEVDPFEMADYLRDGYRLSQPLNCPDQLFEIMTCCWILEPENRPSFSQLLDCLYDFSNALGRYI
ncbi:tyrosine-protein kinase Dnt-like isoform X1 [Macrosteles quadrilineatus]|uniref:tyrosine-protein kinase Dnt-like isoform X1 n=2 Tax=Macrosteles quadrilineatus TaxID=74068 RepID=UPI0023E2EC35|nr:tyrosine-protein kinase Dnt-like isoform X1 [Macrosteles quadrilineatus]